jgi:hypothetical protein
MSTEFILWTKEIYLLISYDFLQFFYYIFLIICNHHNCISTIFVYINIIILIDFMKTNIIDKENKKNIYNLIFLYIKS